VHQYKTEDELNTFAAKYKPYKKEKKLLQHANSDGDQSMYQVAYWKSGVLISGEKDERTELFMEMCAWDENFIVSAGTTGTSDKNKKRMEW
jgi:hypothetical protein